MIIYLDQTVSLPDTLKYFAVSQQKQTVHPDNQNLHYSTGNKFVHLFRT